eukprot:gene12691-26732_t
MCRTIIFTVLIFIKTLVGTTVADGNFINSPIPVHLNLKRVGFRKTNTSSILVDMDAPVRTQPELFARVLKLHPNKPFTMNLDRWRLLKSSGLFANLTAKSYVNDDKVHLEVQGVELPSIRFSPEVSVSASLTRPEVAGG